MVFLKWTPVDIADKYAFEYSGDEQQTWHNGDYSNGKTLKLDGLPSQQFVHIRVRSLASRNRRSPWSEPVRVFVL